MRTTLFLFAVMLSSQAGAQSCRPNIDVKVNICRGVPVDTGNVYCLRYNRGLLATDSNFSIISFAMRAEGPGFDEYIEEANNTGWAWNEAKRIIIKLRAGSLVEFSCIKAKYKGRKNIYILQPLTITLR